MTKDVQSLAKEWFEFAEKDLQAAKMLFKEINHITCFHCQQSAEKYIKGLLVLLQIDFKKSHNLSYLLELLDKNIPNDIMEAAEYLNEFAVEARYPGQFSTVTNEEADKALEYCTHIKKYIINLARDNGFKL
ncbi:HEPN domain-containing protein [Natranaerobius thermophilus]|uniref:HEPN domain protein n=1 Tax=Natranaerobius thermophilus (strain ATCC BAA-1301 / DSM 18059 / JW/NM-WN-LF) TaxID=457570 RepID=B2A0Y8_NATTJ|nr:HEPN domain-containing protein [Natranaerobius thermophilus]ACB84611.1 HEPN domain protein [Natranaerobius thermophilus JW/NM-WN-LF]